MQRALAFTARCYSSRYFPIAANEPKVSPIGLLLRLGIRWIDSFTDYNNINNNNTFYL